MSARRPTVLVAGFSARALARSALRAGLDVVAVDAFGDRDLVEPAPRPRYVPVRPFHPRAAARLAARHQVDAVAYAANFENHPRAVAALAEGRALWGNPASVLRAVRAPERLAAALWSAGVPVPRVADAAPLPTGGAWLAKPRRSGGGHGIRTWAPAQGLRRHEYLQERIEGVPGSLVFLADGRAAAPLALTRQLVGDGRFGAGGYRYAGSLLASRRHSLFDEQEALFESASRAAAAVTCAFGLVGLNTVDFVARDGTAWTVEVNPRPSASVELIERALGTSLFPLHAEAALGGGSRPAHDPLGWARVPGKAVLYADQRTTMTGSDALLRSADVADVSADGTPIPAGGPVCTVFAEGDSAEDCVDALVHRGATILGRLVPASEAA